MLERLTSDCLNHEHRIAIESRTDMRNVFSATHEEYENQCALFEWACRQENIHPELEMLYAVENGERRHPVAGLRLKKKGVKSGLPDIFLDVPRHGYHGLRIELKTEKGKAQKNQLEWLNKFSSYGYLSVICVGWEAAKDTIISYLKDANEDN